MEYESNNMKRIHFCEISDSFVHPNNKLAGGKKGHGEARLFISTSKEYTRPLLKTWKIVFDSNYKEDIKKDVNEHKFIKDNPARYNDMISNIDNINGKTISVCLQNGNSDNRRNYIGGSTKTGKNKFTLWRKSMMPTKTTVEFYDEETHITVIVKHNSSSKKKYNTLQGVSFASLECFKYLEEKLGIEIQTGASGGEFKLRKPTNGYFWPVDGCHFCRDHKCAGNETTPCKWNNNLFEFQGDYWHRNKQEKDAEKKAFYESKGYTVHQIKESDWYKKKIDLIDC